MKQGAVSRAISLLCLMAMLFASPANPAALAAARTTFAESGESAVPVVENGVPGAVVVVADAVYETIRNMDIPSWKQASGTNKYRLSDTHAHSGLYSALIDDVDALSYALESELAAASQGESFTVTAWVYSDIIGKKGTILLRFYDANQQRLSQTSFVAGEAGNWVQLTLTGTAPAGTAYVSATLYSDTTGLRRLYYDDVSLKKTGTEQNLLKNAGFETISSRAADALVDYVGKSTGAELPVFTESAWATEAIHYPDDVPIYIGESVPAADTAFHDAVALLDDDGFVIRTGPSGIAIAGPTDWGTEFGVYDFLERYVGVRWLMPGPDGEDVPAHEDLLIPQETVSDEPAFISRRLSPMTDPTRIGPLPYEWAVKNRMHTRVDGFLHNIWSLFKPSQFAAAHPEFYPLRDGQRYIPADTVQTAWQPCYSEQGTIQAAVYGILDYFAANPDATSFSLAVNDSGGFCEAEPDHPANPHRLNSIGLPDMSDIYYGWVNEVVERVLDVYPDKWFGLLAYQNVMDPPSFPLNPRVIPYITKDRMTWIDEDIREAGESQMEDWAEVADHVAWYDYLYGTTYTLPRVYNARMADNYRYAKEQGVLAQVAEMYPNWGEGPKPWLSAKLQWNPDQDEDDLLDEWYERAVGPVAAPDLKAYYDHWEQFWTERVQTTDWFQSRKNATYLPFNTADYLDIVTDAEIADSRSLLESVVAKAQTAPQLARAQKLLSAFEYYEASALSYPRNVAAPADEDEAMELLDDLEDHASMRLDMADERLTLVDSFKSDPVLMHPWPPSRYTSLLWNGWNPNPFWRMVDYLRENEPSTGPVRQRIEQVGQQTTDIKLEQLYGKLLDAAYGSPLNANASFENGGSSATSWTSYIQKYGEFTRVEDETAFSGDASLYVHDFYYGKLSQIVPAQTGLNAIGIRYYVSADTESVGTIYVTLNLLDAQGHTLQTVNSRQRPFSGSLGQWSTAGLLADVPASVGGTAVTNVQMVVTVNGFFEGGTLYLDDFGLF